MVNNRYDVIVIGLGAMGSAAVYQLASRGLQVLGIDQFSPPHNLGSTHGETRITRLAVGEGAAYVPLVRRSHEIWQALEHASGETLFWKSGGTVIGPKTGGAHFHGAADFVKRTAQLAQANHISHELLTAVDIQQRQPLLQVQDHEHGCYEPGAGVVSPERAVSVQLQQARESGAAIHLEEKVLNFKEVAGGVTVKTTRDTYAAAKLVIAAGPWVTDFLPAAERRPFAVYRQVIYWFEAENLARFRPEYFPWVIWIGETLADYFSVFPTPAMAKPAVKMMTEEYVTPTHPDEVERPVTAGEISTMYENFVQRRLRGLTSQCIDAQVCLYTVTPDEHFVIDWHPEHEQMLIASPCSGHGFKHSAAIGEVIAQLVNDGRCDLDIQSFSFSRFLKHNEKDST